MPVAETFSFPNVAAGTYTMSLRASNGAGVSASSNSVTLTFPGPCSGAPAPPTASWRRRAATLITASWEPARQRAGADQLPLIVTGAFNGALP